MTKRVTVGELAERMQARSELADERHEQVMGGIDEIKTEVESFAIRMNAVETRFAVQNGVAEGRAIEKAKAKDAADGALVGIERWGVRLGAITVLLAALAIGVQALGLMPV